MNAIAGNIALKRKTLGLTQKELAEKLHVSDKTVSRWETGKQIPDALTMQELARTLGVSVAELYGAEREAETVQESSGRKEIPFSKIRKIFSLGAVFAAMVLLIGFVAANQELNSQVSCQMKQLHLYELTGYDSSLVPWVNYCDSQEEELSHISSQAGDTAYYLFYLPRGCEETELDYSYSYGLRGPVLRLNFKNLADKAGEDYFLCYMKFPCEGIFRLETRIEGKRTDSNGGGYAMFVGLCENILFKD